jgi:hypothetical protein
MTKNGTLIRRDALTYKWQSGRLQRSHRDWTKQPFS